MLTVGTTILAGAESLGKDLGLRKEDPASAGISRASSVRESPQPFSVDERSDVTENEDIVGTRTHSAAATEVASSNGEAPSLPEVEGRIDTAVGRAVESGVEMLAGIMPGRTKTTNSNNLHREEQQQHAHRQHQDTPPNPS